MCSSTEPLSINRFIIDEECTVLYIDEEWPVLQEYLAICEEYGVEVTEEDLQNVIAIADENGEVSHNNIRQKCKHCDTESIKHKILQEN
jgi:hypothetical protein